MKLATSSASLPIKAKSQAVETASTSSSTLTAASLVGLLRTISTDPFTATRISGLRSRCRAESSQVDHRGRPGSAPDLGFRPFPSAGRARSISAMTITTARPARRLLIAALALTTVALTFLPVPDATAAAPAQDGVWQTDGYNVIVAINNDSAQFYDLTKISCAVSDSAVKVRPGAFEGDGSRFTFRRLGAGAVMQVEGSVGVQR